MAKKRKSRKHSLAAKKGWRTRRRNSKGGRKKSSGRKKSRGRRKSRG